MLSIFYENYYFEGYLICVSLASNSNEKQKRSQNIIIYLTTEGFAALLAPKAI